MPERTDSGEFHVKRELGTVEKVIVGVAITVIAGGVMQALYLYGSVREIQANLVGTNNRLERMSATLNQLRGLAADRWTKADHTRYESRVERQIADLQARVRELEKATK